MGLQNQFFALSWLLVSSGHRPSLLRGVAALAVLPVVTTVEAIVARLVASVQGLVVNVGCYFLSMLLLFMLLSLLLVVVVVVAAAVVVVVVAVVVAAVVLFSHRILTSTGVQWSPHPEIPTLPGTHSAPFQKCIPKR